MKQSKENRKWYCNIHHGSAEICTCEKQSKEMEMCDCGLPLELEHIIDDLMVSIAMDRERLGDAIKEWKKPVLKILSQNFIPKSQAIIKSEMGNIYTILEIASVDLPQARKLLKEIIIYN